MNKLKRKSYLILIAATGMLILLSTLLLKKGISYVSESSIGRVENVSVQKIAEKPIAKNNNSLNGETVTLKQQETLEQYSKPPTRESIEKESSKGTPIDMKKQEELYQSVKDKLNIQKEDAITIFNKNIHNLFGESPDISRDNLFLMKNYISENESYNWCLSVENGKNKKYYWCILNAMTGQCTKIFRTDYSGLKNPQDGLFNTSRYTTLKDYELDLYINKTKEIITKNNIFNRESNNINDISLQDSLYMGLRPLVFMKANMENRKSVLVGFYIDTGELVSIDLQNN